MVEEMGQTALRVRVRQDRAVYMDHPMAMSLEYQRCNGTQWLLASQESSAVLSLLCYNMHMLRVCMDNLNRTVALP